MQKVKIKTAGEIKKMQEGGRILAMVRRELADSIKEGVSAWEIEKEAATLIKRSGAEASFKRVPGYSWATCVNVNEGVVHGIPKKEIVFKKGDVVSVDLGIYYKGFHTDGALSVLVGPSDAEAGEKVKFLEAGRRALNAGIASVKRRRKIGDISGAIGDSLAERGLAPVKSLTGHGVGRDLHEAPFIPCARMGTADEKVAIETGFVLAIEVMYTTGSGEIEVAEDGWTIRTKDGKIAALFEETVAIGADGPIILTHVPRGVHGKLK